MAARPGRKRRLEVALSDKKTAQEVDDVVSNYRNIVAGTNVTLTDDGQNVTVSASGGGGGSAIDPSYQSATITDTTITSIDTWTDVGGASITVTPSGSEKWEIIVDVDVYMFHNDGSQVMGNLRVVDSSNNLIDNCVKLVSHRAYSAGTASIFSVYAVARDAINAAKTYKLQIRKGTNGASVSIYNGNVTGELTGDDTRAKFYAKRVF